MLHSMTGAVADIVQLPLPIHEHKELLQQLCD